MRMKTLSSEINGTHNESSERHTHLLNEKRGHNSSKIKEPLIKNINSAKDSLSGYKERLFNDSTSSNNYDTRSQSLPDCWDDNTNKLRDNLHFIDNCDVNSKLLIHNSPPHSPTNDMWFKTWPERCDKIKSNELSPDSSTKSVVSNVCKNTQLRHSNCDVGNSNVKNKFTLNEALQNISLAYSPVTKQLHLVEKIDVLSKRPNVDSEDISGNFNKEDLELDKRCNIEFNNSKKSGHKRTEAGSFSSTISTVSTLSGISDPSPSGSLLGSEDRSLHSFDITSGKTRKKSITNFFTRNVFSWKSGTNDINNYNSSVWKLFSKHSNSTSNSPVRVVASSSALIQHESLPAKALEEEQRHREEYKAIIAAAKRKEAKSTAAKQKQQKLQLQLEEQQATSTKHFIQQVLPNWETMRTNKKTQELWWQGLPSSVRGKVWRLAIGNELNVTSQLYEICLCRAQNRLNSPEPPKCDSNVDPESSMDVIQLDISRTFPHLCIFQEGGPYSETLHSLLAAYVCYRPDVGYVQGMSYIAAILILNMEPFDAFICFANLLNQPLHLSAFTLNQAQMQAYYDAYNEVFKFNLPKLYSHFEKSGLTPDLYLLDWIYTIFAKAMPLDIACRVWDIFLRDGFEFIFRTALGILHLNQDVLMEMDFLHGAQFLTHLPEDTSSDQLFKSIQVVNTTIGKRTFTQIVDKYVFSTTSQCS
ncbi:TBC1 domain family member 14-like isoform X2 [Anoplophora glabripennis]|uniref:TBC1 domain family member 14-like isoform X2 n=1 Tax=Anoplophora glabripennis TaxID=217634 RepID=UPI00087392B0|nr:TBC1 domain family member 14-like isoform X2 [Anoplophora glabripennis]